ncbi:MAG TPA: dihydrolipoamide acetyltransferase family protein [Phycisphaerales bacterium]|nr:dihydrolipoamide acetyltransferase family protein [Phycisphaerales bacterium]
MAHHKSSDPNIFILPDLGEGVHEAELISWKVKPGEKVDEHQTVAEMNTDKALVEVPSPRAGVIKELFGKPGEILKVGQVAWTYEGAASGAGTSGGGKPAAGGASRGSANHQPRVNPAADVPFDSGPDGAHADVPPPSEEREDAGTVVGTMSGSLGAVSREGGKALATPAVRRLARDLGVDIDSVAGSGIAGRVTEKDVRGAASSGPAPAQRRAAPEPPSRPAPQPARQVQPLATTVPQQVIEPRHSTVLVPTGDTTRIPIRGVRRTIANRLRQSMDRAVHFSVFDDADVTELDSVRTRLAAASGEKVSYLPFVISAVCRALKKFPALNATIEEGEGVEEPAILRHHLVHMGMATDSEQGLSVPVIPNADAMGVLEIGRHVAELARMTRDRTIPRERLMGSTFTISNVGSYAGKYATPVINYPEVGILAAGRVREGIVARNGGIHVAKLLPLSLTCDHRCVDGADAARCLAYIIELIQRPEELLTPARG